MIIYACIKQVLNIKELQRSMRKTLTTLERWTHDINRQ